MSFQPELGQTLFGNHFEEYGVPNYAIALIEQLFKEVDRIYWNHNQEEWENGLILDWGVIEYRPYYWGDDEEEALQPNFKYKDVEIRWYKRLGRGTSCNKNLTSKEWIEWFNSCLIELRMFEEAAQRKCND